eukprot:836414-Amphidinium_carterae.2
MLPHPCIASCQEKQTGCDSPQSYSGFNPSCGVADHSVSVVSSLENFTQQCPHERLLLHEVQAAQVGLIREQLDLRL